ncbi:MAG: STAS domain-containing protein [Verrucomicrobiia bacterium]
MATAQQSRIAEILRQHERALLTEWVREQLTPAATQALAIKEEELVRHCSDFLPVLRQALEGEEYAAGSQDSGWGAVREILSDISRSRSRLGFSPSETATFVFSLKRPVFARLREAASDPDGLAADIWAVTEILDGLGLFTAEVHQKSREEIILRQHQEMMELSTPVVKLWDGILALPLIGTLDSARTQVVMEVLLQRIVETGSRVAIIDITGVPTVDTLVAQHLLKTVTAARLMGADCIISGIRPQIAQTIVHLGVTLNVTTKASLADAFRLALQRLGSSLQDKGQGIDFPERR